MVRMVERITELVAGRMTIEKHEKRALERYHEKRGTETYLESLSIVTGPEPTPTILSSKQTHTLLLYQDTNSVEGQCSVSSSLTSSPATIRTSSSFVSSIRAPCPHVLQRSHSDVSPTVPYLSPIGPPDLTATDLSDDEIRRTYSTNDLWDTKQHKLAPILPCTGIGKFRMSVNAEPDFQLRKLRESFGNMPVRMIDLIPPSNVNGSIDPEVWQKFRSEQISRHNSFASSRSSASVEFIEPDTGTRVTRGFSPSLPSSVRSSPTGRYADSRRSSTLSGLSPATGTDGGCSPHSSRRRSNRNGDTNILSPLSTIREMHKQQEQPIKKIEVPCNFSSTGDPDSAFVSDCEDDSWDEVAESTTQARRSSELSRLMQSRKTTPNGLKPSLARPQLSRAKTDSEQQTSTKGPSRTILDRNRTVRLARPQFRRGHVRGQANGPVRNVEAAKDQEKSNPQPQARLSRHPILVQEPAAMPKDSPRPVDSSTELEDSPGDLALWMIDVTEIKNIRLAAHIEDVNPAALTNMNGSQTDGNVRQRQRSGTAFRTSETSETIVKEEET